MGRTCFDKDFLKKSFSSDQISFVSGKSEIRVSNRFYDAKVDTKTGQILSLKDKRTKNFHREIVKQPLNQLIIHDDVPFFWDNWDIMHHAYETKVKKVQDNLTNYKVIIDDARSVCLRFEFKISEKSKMTQDIIFYNYSAKIDFKTNVDWYESRKLLKAYFPVNIRTDYATFDISSGLLRRPIHTNTSWDQARLEVCGHKFVDLSESRFGVSLLNDCKYGYTVRDQTIGLSLLKAGEFPWEKTDKKNHEFIYSLLCHDKPLADSNVFDEAYKLNTPLWAAIVEKPELDVPEGLEGTKLVSPISEVPPLSYFELIDTPNCVLTAFKRSERDAQKYVARLAEVRGEEAMAILSFNQDLFNFSQVKVCTGLENELD